MEEIPNVDTKTFGLCHLFQNLMKDEIGSLSNYFDEETVGRLLSFAQFRWGYQSSINGAMSYHSHDFSSEIFYNKSLNDKSLSSTLKYLGENRELAVRWMNSLLKTLPDEARNFVLMDSTHSTSLSDNLAINKVGYNPDFDYEKRIRLMYLFSAQMKQPVYYRLINGNITDVKSMSLCVKEMGIDDAIFIADKGFFSDNNVAELEAEKRQYVIPIKRDNPLIGYAPLQNSDFKKTNRYFRYQERVIWYYEYQRGDYKLVTFLDETLRRREENEYLHLIDQKPEAFSKEKLDEKLGVFGTLTMVYKINPRKEKTEKQRKNTGKTIKEIPVAQTVYENYKVRNEVEIMFDSYKNYLKADVTYMQNRHVLEGWLFANFIAMIAYYKLFVRLKEANLLHKHSPKDIIELSKSIAKLKIRAVWHLSEMTKKEIDLFAKIKINYLN